uniref:Immunoglobulin C1-set domain-containing protein n=1 Tax=Mola mola TaxID=94237 RepID=A0A3Q4AZS0_MOLML
MRALLCLAFLTFVCASDDLKYTPPKVQVYSRNPGELDQMNTLICHNWHFHLTKSATFTPKSGQKYSCKVTHGRSVNDYAWEPNM